MPKKTQKLKKFLFTLALGLTAGALVTSLSDCNIASVECDCAQQLNLTLYVRDASDSSCIASPTITVNGRDDISTMYVPEACGYSVPTGSGKIEVTVAKAGYRTQNLASFQIDFHDNGCCGHYDEKSFNVYLQKE